MNDLKVEVILQSMVCLVSSLSSKAQMSVENVNIYSVHCSTSVQATQVVELCHLLMRQVLMLILRTRIHLLSCF